MKILFIVNNFNIGGPQKSLLSLMYYLPKDLNLTLLVLNGEDQLSHYLPESVKVINGDKNTQLLMLNKSNFIKNLIYSAFKNPTLCFRAQKDLIKAKLTKKTNTHLKQEFWYENKDLHSNNLNEEFDIAIAVSGGHSLMYLIDFVKSKKKVGWVRTEYQNLNRNTTLDSIYFNDVDKVLSVSKKCTEKFIEIFPECKNRVSTFYNPLPYEMYNKNFDNKISHDTNSEFTMSTISRLDKNKGFDLLIDIAILLKEFNINFSWNIYGVGSEKTKIKKAIKVNKLDSFVKLKGFVLNTGNVLKQTDVLIHLSKFEGKSNTIDEAKYYETPIISTKYPTVTEQIEDGYTGLLVDYEKYEIVETIIRLSKSNSLIEKLKYNLRKENSQIKNRDIYFEFKKAIGSE